MPPPPPSSLRVNRRGVAGTVLQPPVLLINSLMESVILTFRIPIVRARELKFWENVHPHHVSHVTCHKSGVTCAVSHFNTYIYFYKMVKLVWYQLGISHLVYFLTRVEGEVGQIQILAQREGLNMSIFADIVCEQPYSQFQFLFFYWDALICSN